MSFFNKNFKKINQLIARIENSQIGLKKWLITFLCLIFIRNFLEIFSTKTYYFSSRHFLFFFFHSTVSYFFVLLAIILILYFLTKERIEKISRIALWGVVVILLPPIIDLIATGGTGAVIKYRQIGYIENVWSGIKLFFDYILYSPFSLFFKGDNSFSLSQIEINYGIRIEVLIIFLLIIWYIFLKTKNILKVCLGLFFSYLIFFILGTFPYLMAFILGLPAEGASFHGASNLNPSFDWNKIIFSLYFILIIIFALICFYVYHKEKFLAVIKNLRPIRVVNNLLFLFLGLIVALHVNNHQIIFKPFDYLLVLTACLAIIFYWFFAVFSNDLADKKTDKISSPNRPLPSGKLSVQEIKTMASIFQVISYACALIVSYAFFIIIFIRSCLAYLYSWYPFRVKRIPLLSGFLLAVGYWLTVLGGYLILSSNSAYNFPGRLSFVILVGFTLAVNFKDIKDYQGDKKDRIYTLVVLLGPKKGKIIIGFLGAFAFLLFPLVYQEYLKITLIPCLATALIYFYLVNRKKYNEKLIFLLVFLYIISIILIAF
jgi:4-hydroxybenzoate polyprenyltransferase